VLSKSQTVGSDTGLPYPVMMVELNLGDKIENKMRLLYVMDPMCGWCYGFQPELENFLVKYHSVKLEWIMGGLAPDTKQPMDDNLKKRGIFIP
jgi:hypothetical protein